MCTNINTPTLPQPACTHPTTKTGRILLLIVNRLILSASVFFACLFTSHRFYCVRLYPHVLCLRWRYSATYRFGMCIVAYSVILCGHICLESSCLQKTLLVPKQELMTWVAHRYISGSTSWSGSRLVVGEAAHCPGEHEAIDAAVDILL